MWAKLAGRMVSGTVGEQLAEEWQSLLKPGPDRIDLEELERLFSLEERAKKSAAKAPAKKKATPKTPANVDHPLIDRTLARARCA